MIQQVLVNLLDNAAKFAPPGTEITLSAARHDDELRVEVWLMSCRVMGRRAEEVMIGAVLRYAGAAGYSRVDGDYIMTASLGPDQFFVKR